ncbi:MAG: SDR family NAD(P)-dependent oxidoreductase [Planctomycetaceae bacterium]
METTDRLSGQVAIVTGGGSGIGQAVVASLVESGVAGVAIADIDPVENEGLHRDTDVNVISRRVDVADSSAVRQFVADTHTKFGRIDILVNNAGIAPVVSWADVTEENWRRVLDVNLSGAFFCAREVLPHMRKQRSGRIVNVSSVGAFLGSQTAHPAYGVSKAGLIALTKSLAKECAADGILVNAIAPGSIDTPLLNQLGEDARAEYAEASLLKRQGSARELADAVIFLVSGSATYITGSTLHVNGGSLLI